MSNTTKPTRSRRGYYYDLDASPHSIQVADVELKFPSEAKLERYLQEVDSRKLKMQKAIRQLNITCFAEVELTQELEKSMMLKLYDEHKSKF